MKKELVSIIVPVYNVESWIYECIQSILKQSYTNFELLIINDGSTDNSIYKIKDLIKNDERVKLFNRENRGVASSRNFGMDQSKGEYIIFVDSDDKITANMLESCINLFNTTNVDIVAFNASVLDENNIGIFDKNKYKQKQLVPSKIYQSDEFIRRNGTKIVSVCLYIYKNKFLKSNNIRFNEGIIHEDVVFWLDILLCKFTISYLDQNFYIRRVRENSIMTGNNILKSQEGYKFAASYIKDDILKMRSLSRTKREYFISKMVRYYQNTYKGNKLIELIVPLLRGVSIKNYFSVMIRRFKGDIPSGE
ncbi:glycosyltransferase [Lactococcus lactis]|uniref:glycosyltransferase n=1 Tax=Lactococcus lactis TaxID=1358 RepID=UPI003D17AE9F